MALQSVQPDSAGARRRVLSAAVLAPAVLAAIAAGWPFVHVLVTVAAIVMAWEVIRLAWWERGPRLAIVLSLVLGAGLAIASAGRPDVGALIVVSLAAAVAGAFKRRRSPLLGLALAYIGLACMTFLWLRAQAEIGFGLTVWLVAAVWATDTGAMAAGKAIGGVRLAPVMSPNKTWAGLIGGMVAAAVASWLAGIFFPAVPKYLDLPGAPVLALIGAGLAVVAQVGDLFESGYKRYFGAKDSSHLIPGHGGLLDRADGLLLVSLVLAFVVYLQQGAS